MSKKNGSVYPNCPKRGLGQRPAQDRIHEVRAEYKANPKALTYVGRVQGYDGLGYSVMFDAYEARLQDGSIVPCYSRGPLSLPGFEICQSYDHLIVNSSVQQVA